MVPTSTKAPCSGVRPRNRVMSPIDSTPTTGQNSSSKKKKTLRIPMMVLRTTTAHDDSSSARQFNEHVLQLWLADLQVADLHAVGGQRPQQLGHALLRMVHRELQPAVGLGHSEDTGRVRQPPRARRIQAEGDDLAEPH